MPKAATMPKAGCKKRSFVDALHGLDNVTGKKTKVTSGAVSRAEVNIFISEYNSEHETLEVDNSMSGREHVVSPGQAIALKFKDCQDVSSLLKDNNKEAACRFADGFDTMVDVPRIMNINVVSETFPNPTKPQMIGPQTLSVLYNEGISGGSPHNMAFIGEDSGEQVKVFDVRYTHGKESGNRGVPVTTVYPLANKFGRDFFTVMTTKVGMKSLLQTMNEMGYFNTVKSRRLTKLDWVELMRTAKPSAIWSEYYSWCVDGFQSYGYHKDRIQGETGDAYNYWADSINKVEIGHYEKERHNINDYLCGDIPNDYYADGVVVGVIQPDQTVPGYMNGFNLKLDIEYKKVKVKYGAVYLNSLKGVYDLVTSLKDVKKSVFYRDGTATLGGTTVNNRPYDKLTCYVHGGLEVYGVDMLNLWQKSDGTLAGYSDSGIFNATSLFEENDIIPEFDVTKN